MGLGVAVVDTLVVVDLVDLLFDFVVGTLEEDHAYLVDSLEQVHTLVDIDLLAVQDIPVVVRHRTIMGKSRVLPAADYLDHYVQRLIPSLDQYHYGIYPIFLHEIGEILSK